MKRSLVDLPVWCLVVFASLLISAIWSGYALLAGSPGDILGHWSWNFDDPAWTWTGYTSDGSFVEYSPGWGNQVRVLVLRLPTPLGIIAFWWPAVASVAVGLVTLVFTPLPTCGRLLRKRIRIPRPRMTLFRMMVVIGSVSAWLWLGRFDPYTRTAGTLIVAFMLHAGFRRSFLAKESKAEGASRGPFASGNRRLFPRLAPGPGLGGHHSRLGFVSRASALTEARMLLIFRCENCGKRFRVKDRYRGRKGRCKYCGHVMIIPRTLTEVTIRKRDAHEPLAAAPAAAPTEEPLFRLSPPEPSPRIITTQPPLEIEQQHQHQPTENQHGALGAPLRREPQPSDEPEYEIELIDDDEDIRAGLPVSPQIERGLREMAEFARDPRGYSLETSPSGWGIFAFRRHGGPGPANWLVVMWRAAITRILKLLRWIDAWAYLISVPFLVLLAVGIAVSNTPVAHVSALVVVLVNYGRFWTDLLALFVRPFKRSPLHGLAFLFPPYGLYFIATRWKQMKPTLRRMATSCIPIVLVVLAYAFSPLINPGVESVEGVGAKLEAGQKQLVKDIHQGVREIRGDIGVRVREIQGRLPSLETRPKAEPEPKP